MNKTIYLLYKVYSEQRIILVKSIIIIIKILETTLCMASYYKHIGTMTLLINII